MLRGEAITEDGAREWLGYIGLVCRPGETVTLLALIARPGFRPKFNAFAVTNQRVMTVTVKNLAKQGPAVALELGDITRIEVASRGVGAIILADRGGQRYLFGQLAHDSDIGMICQHLTALAPWAEVAESPTKTTHSFLGTATTSSDGLGSRMKSAFNGEQTHQSRESPQEEPAATAEAAPPPDGFVTYGSQPAPDPRPQFDASRPPKPGDPVPADCVWAIRQHPGPMPGRATFGNHAKRMRIMGDPTARTEAEIVSALGRPQSRSVTGADGSYMLQWQHDSKWSYNSHFALQFDRYGVCAGITHEWQAL